MTNNNKNANSNINIEEFDIIFDVPDDFRNNLLNECMREKVSYGKNFSLNSDNENINNGNKKNSSNLRYRSFQNSNSNYQNNCEEIDNYNTYLSENKNVLACDAGVKKLNITKSGKLFIMSYLILMAIIIILVVMSVSRGGFSLASSGSDNDLESKSYAVYTLDEEYYNNLNEIDYKNVESDKLIILTPQTEKTENTSWFDNLCDSIENLVGD